MSLRQRIALLLGALAAISAGLWIIISVGLPSRASYTGYLIPERGFVAPEVNAQAPPFTLPTLNGETVTLEAFIGQPVIINFWATWCGPCRVEMPILQRLYEQHGPDSVQILAVNVGEPVELIQAWAQQMRLTYPLLIDPQEQVSRRYHLRGQPSTYIIGRDGVISQIFYGPVTEETLTHALAVHLSG